MTENDRIVWEYLLKNRQASTVKVAEATGVSLTEVESIIARIGSPNWREEVSKPQQQARLRILARAAEVTGGERQDSYGPVKQNLQRIADLWTAYLDRETVITAEDAAWMMVLLKMARSDASAYHEDNYIDAAAYAGIAGECRESAHADSQRG